MAQPAFASFTPTIELYGDYTTSVASAGGSPTGSYLPTINDNGLKGYAGSNPWDFSEALTYGAKAASPSLLFTVDPSNSGNGIETYTITVDFKLWAGASVPKYAPNSNTALNLVETATATFDYYNQTDNICWNAPTITKTQNTSVYSSSLLSSSGPVVACNSSTPSNKSVTNDYEQILIHLGSNYYDVDLYDWNDWDEAPEITFAWSDPPKLPEPASLALLSAGLFGLGGLAFLRRRKANRSYCY